MSVRLTKVHHACVFLDDGRTRLLVDPGQLGPAPSLCGVDAVLVTHRHFDHIDPDLIRRALRQEIPVWAPADAIADLHEGEPGLHEAVGGDSFTIGTLRVAVTGSRHAELAPDRTGPQNRAFLIAGSVLVTGDEHVPVPAEGVDTLVTPIDAPWLRATDLIRYVRTIRPKQVVGIHDGLLNADGLAVARQVAVSLQAESTPVARILADGEALLIP